MNVGDRDTWSRTEVVAEAMAEALIDQPHDGNRFTSIHDYTKARLSGDYDLYAVANKVIERTDGASKADIGDQVSAAIELAAWIREVDGNHDMGAAALAEALIARGVAIPTPVRQTNSPVN